ncbi:hypothetical protein DAPPUDRAFT_116210 [Daphnia pulex]|uniref:JmjC domain-containing protein n=1 Tax=Daphnia pulex TaxID=6669 RepID=E9HNX4_DAPPU|nr:hypothetical protein DAPPUDRAFT_116210 [Daphnia pulex]|eukprot:EFX66557.1 hypothetical protein DAPPUDRAFT_116210 [Daphnia pulex]
MSGLNFSQFLVWPAQSFTGFHVENLNSASVNFLDSGFAYWIIVPAQYGETLLRLLEKLYLDDFADCSHFGCHKSCLVMPQQDVFTDISHGRAALTSCLRPVDTRASLGVDFAVDLEEGELEAKRLPVVYTTIEDGLGMIILFPVDIYLLDAGQKLNYSSIVDGCLAYVMRVFLIILKNPFVCSALFSKKLRGKCGQGKETAGIRQYSHSHEIGKLYEDVSTIKDNEAIERLSRESKTDNDYGTLDRQLIRLLLLQPNDESISTLPDVTRRQQLDTPAVAFIVGCAVRLSDCFEPSTNTVVDAEMQNCWEFVC